MKRQTILMIAGIAMFFAACKNPAEEKVKEQKVPGEVKAPALEQVPGGALKGIDFNDELRDKIASYLKTAFNLPENASMMLSPPQASPIKGFYTIKVVLSAMGRTQNFEIYLYEDARHLLVGRILDLEGTPWERKDMSNISLGDSPAKGPKNAPITILEFSDFQCPFCARVYDTIEEQVLKTYRKKVRFVYKHFPLTNIHPWAKDASVASECAYKQKEKAFWTFYEKFYTEQQGVTVENIKTKVTEWAKDAGIDVEKFKECYDKKETAHKVERDMNEGASLGVSGTPAFFVNGIFLSGAQPFERFQEVIEYELKKRS